MKGLITPILCSYTTFYPRFCFPAHPQGPPPFFFRGVRLGGAPAASRRLGARGGRGGGAETITVCGRELCAMLFLEPS